MLDAGPDGPFATGNRVTGNVLTDNDLDVLVDTAGTGGSRDQGVIVAVGAASRTARAISPQRPR